MGTHTNSTRSILDSFRRIVQGLRNSSRQSSRSAGLTSAQFFVLQQIGTRESLTVNELAELTYTHQSTVSETIGRLVKQELVIKRKSPEDSRKTLLSLTRKGRAILTKSPPAAQECLLEALHGLTETQRQKLSKLLERVVAEAGFADQPATLFFEEAPRKGKSP